MFQYIYIIMLWHQQFSWNEFINIPHRSSVKIWAQCGCFRSPRCSCGWLLRASRSSLHTSSVMSKLCFDLFSSPASSPLWRRLSRTIFLSSRRHGSLHSPHTKYLTLYSFPFIAGSSTILLPWALWDVVALYCFWCSQTIWSYIEHIPPLVFLCFCDIALRLNYSSSNSPLSTCVEALWVTSGHVTHFQWGTEAPHTFFFPFVPLQTHAQPLFPLSIFGFCWLSTGL